MTVLASKLFCVLDFRSLSIREGLKEVENSTVGGRGGQQGSFSTFNFLIFYAPNGLKVNFRH